MGYRTESDAIETANDVLYYYLSRVHIYIGIRYRYVIICNLLKEFQLGRSENIESRSRDGLTTDNAYTAAGRRNVNVAKPRTESQKTMCRNRIKLIENLSARKYVYY